jgi:hypothetical protein
MTPAGGRLKLRRQRSGIAGKHVRPERLDVFDDAVNAWHIFELPLRDGSFKPKYGSRAIACEATVPGQGRDHFYFAARVELDAESLDCTHEALLDGGAATRDHIGSFKPIPTGGMCLEYDYRIL